MCASYTRHQVEKIERPVIIKSEFTKTKYERREIIGEGAYGKVYRAIDQTTRELVALKAVNLNGRDRDEGFPISTIREITVLKNLSHPNIVQLHDIVVHGEKWETNKNAQLLLALDYCPHDFCGIINDRDLAVNQPMIKSFIFQLLNGVHYLHSQGVMHRDIKTSNILVSFNGEVKLADFGLSCFVSLDPNEDYQPLVVTRWYRSPELLLGETHYDFAIDMWSIGCILAEFMLKAPLFCGNDTKDQLRLIFEVCGTPDRNDWPQAQNLKMWPEFAEYHKPNRLHEKFARFTKSPVFDLLTRLLCLNPKKRITAEQALKHDWFTTDPIPNKNAARLPGQPRNELWVRGKYNHQPAQAHHQQNAQQQQQQQQHVMNHTSAVSSTRAAHVGQKRMRDTGNSQQMRYIPPANPVVVGASAHEPPRKQRRLDVHHSNQNHYRSHYNHHSSSSSSNTES